MRVLHVIPAIADRYGGPSHAVVGMGRALGHAGVEVLIATTDADGARDRLPLPLAAELSWRDVPTIVFRRQWSEAFKYSRPLAHWLQSHVTEYDVVHVHAVFSHACLAAADASRRKRVPYIVRPLGTLDPWSLRQKSLRKHALWQLGCKRMLMDAAAVHYTTPAEQKLAENGLGLRRGVVVPLGVDDALFASGATPPEDAGHPYVLILGRLHPKKNLEPFVDAFLELIRQPNRNHWRLMIAGDGDADYVNALRQRVQAQGASEVVQFVGWLNGDRKMTALREAELLALPSHQENFGIVVAEALACGTPVLVSEHVNLADSIARVGAGWVVGLDQRALVAALDQALADAHERQTRGCAGRELATHQFTWSSVARQLTGLYADVARVA